MKAETRDLWEQVKANIKRLDECARHRFAETEVKVGQKITCTRCGGTMSILDAGNYVKGYEAAGRDPADVWPAFRARSASLDSPLPATGGAK